jgi:hypothetical protein
MIVPQELAAQYQLQIGDQIPVYTVYKEGRQVRAEFTLVGLFEPTYQLAQPMI